jgi:hypothetical protein
MGALNSCHDFMKKYFSISELCRNKPEDQFVVVVAVVLVVVAAAVAAEFCSYQSFQIPPNMCGET